MTLPDDLTYDNLAAAVRQAGLDIADESQDYRKVFDLGRLLYPIHRQLAEATICSLVEDWYEYAACATYDLDDAHEELLAVFRRGVRIPKGSSVPHQAWQRVQKEPHPPEADRYPTPRMRQLVALCYQLEQITNPRQQPGKARTACTAWYLSGRLAAELLGGKHRSAANKLSRLVADGVLIRVSRGDTHRAARYRWNTSGTSRDSRRMGAAQRETERARVGQPDLRVVPGAQRAQRSTEDAQRARRARRITKENKRSARSQLRARAREGDAISPNPAKSAPASGRTTGPEKAVRTMSPAETSAAASAVLDKLRKAG